MITGYIESIWTAVICFPLIAFVFTFPYMFYSYRKYGSFLGMRVFIFYTFMLYLLCAYCLVILPLPDESVVALRGGYSYSIVPFTFIKDIIKEFIKNKSIFTNRALVQVIFNIIMTIPFGMYLRYFFECSLKKTILLGFLLSLFFELTQLTGLYFIYPYNYRLFDVDDLMLNTLGTFIGYLLVKPVLFILPDRDKFIEASYVKGERVGVVRRFGSYIFDTILISSVVYLCGIESRFITYSISIVILIIVEMIYGRTLGMFIFNIKMISRNSDKIKPKQIIIRNSIYFVIFKYIPLGITTLVNKFHETELIDTRIKIVINAGVIFAVVALMVRELLRIKKNEQPFWDHHSNILLISNVKRKKED